LHAENNFPDCGADGCSAMMVVNGHGIRGCALNGEGLEISLFGPADEPFQLKSLKKSTVPSSTPKLLKWIQPMGSES